MSVYRVPLEGREKHTLFSPLLEALLPFSNLRVHVNNSSGSWQNPFFLGLGIPGPPMVGAWVPTSVLRHNPLSPRLQALRGWGHHCVPCKTALLSCEFNFFSFSFFSLPGIVYHRGDRLWLRHILTLTKQRVGAPQGRDCGHFQYPEM